MDMKLELVPVPVSDADRAKDFYMNKLGFHLDHDIQPASGVRIMQLTPPGSACSILISTGLGEISQMQPGSIKGLHLVVGDVYKTREALMSQGVEVGEIDDHDPTVKYFGFSDPDGNSWVIQAMAWRSAEF